MYRHFFEKLSTVERLQFTLNHPNMVFDENRNHVSGIKRYPEITEALFDAVDALPPGRSRRALEYVALHDNVIFNFSGTDAVGPAIQQAIELLKKNAA